MSRALVSLGVCLALLVLGCGGSSDGPKLARVSGTVTVGGQPLADAIVTFTPENARPSKATTDSAGRFDLLYTSDKKGAVIGQHTVRVRRIQPDDTDTDGDEVASQDLPPAATDGSVKKEVKAGSNNISIEL